MIHAERKKKKISLQELADKVQVTPSFLSQIENGKNEPSLTTLLHIAACLDVTVGQLLGEAEQPASGLVKKEERLGLAHLGNGVQVEFLSTFDPAHHMEACIHVLAPGRLSEHVTYTHAGQKFLYVIEGSIHLDICGNAVEMHIGDAYYLADCLKPHCFYNLSDSSCARILCMATPPFYFCPIST